MVIYGVCDSQEDLNSKRHHSVALTTVYCVTTLVVFFLGKW